jgi:ribonuclease G
VIDDTEAMTVIDVNSGRNVGRGGNRLEDTITKTNLEAAVEVVRQLRLRDIGGIVIIDFIDMDDAENRRAVKAALDAELARDRTRTFVVDISPLGLVEMTRQNISDGPREVMTEACPDCDGGLGFVVSDETNAISVERAVRKKAAGLPAGDLALVVHPRVAALLLDDDAARLAGLEEDTGRSIRLERDGGLARDGVRLSAAVGRGGSPGRRGGARAPGPPPAPEAASGPAAEAPAEAPAGEASATPDAPRPRSRRRVTSRARATQA